MSARTPHLSEPCAVLSDIHGNAIALKSVLSELETLGIGKIFVAGDHFLGGNAPLETWQLLNRVDARCIRGVSDTALCKISPSALHPTNEDEHERAAAFRATIDSLGELLLERVRRLPDRLRVPLIDGSELLMVHGSPLDPHQEMSVDMSDEELLALVADDPADIIACGGTHVPFQRALEDVTIVNVGSVGAAPGANTAHYAIVTPRMNGALIEARWVEYR